MGSDCLEAGSLRNFLVLILIGPMHIRWFLKNGEACNSNLFR